jgi:hypothetical protein
MALQLVYTSAPKLLDAGRSGFGVVARSKNLPPLAANAIERFSKFANMQGTDRSRIVMAHRKVTIGNTRLHVLSRIRDSGSDHTGRTNHIAHHLIFSPLEIRQVAAQRLTPADVFAQFAWLDRWEGAPRAFDGSADVQIGNFIPHYAATGRAAWAAATGEPLHSRLLAWDGAPKSGALILPDGIGIPQMLGEALAECQNPWEKTFTTSLEPTDELAELDWVIAYRSDASAISRVSSRTVFDISRPLDLPVPAEAALPQPDTRAAASHQDTAMPSQGRVLPPPDLSPRPIDAQTITPASQELRKSGTTAAPNTRQTGNGKLWAIIGGGIAALFLLLVTALFLMNTNKTKRAKAAEETRKKDELAQLISGLTGQGVSEPDAKRILDLRYDNSVIQRLPNDISTLKVSINELGAQITDNGSPAPALEKFEKATAGIVDLENLPEGSLCKELWRSLAIIRTLHRGDTSPKSPTETLGDLKSSLQRAATLTDPEWIKQEQINRIYSVLWEWKYNSMVGELVEGKNSVTVKAVEEFMHSRKSGDQEMITDGKLKAIHDRLDADMLQKYADKLSPELRKKFSLPEAKAKPENIAAADTKPPKRKEKPTTPSMPELADEEWCVVDPNGSGSFRVKLPKSKFLQAISIEKDKNKILYWFDPENKIQFEDFAANPEITLSELTLSCVEKIPPALLQKPLSIEYQNKKIIIHFGKWPDNSPKEFQITARSKRVANTNKKIEHAFLYEITLEGKGLKQLAVMRDKTIPNAQLFWRYLNQAQAVGEANERIVHNWQPTEKEVESPSGKIKDTIKQIVDQVQKKTDEATKARKDKKGDKSKFDDSEHEDIWEEFGEKILEEKNNAETKKWLEDRLAIEANSPKLKDIDKIGGDLSINEQVFLSVIKNPDGKFFPPHLASPITFQLQVDGKSIFNRKLTVESAP